MMLCTVTITHMKSRGMTAVPKDCFLVAANPAESPVMSAYDTSIPDNDMKNDCRRPSFSVLMLAVTAKIKFQIADEVSEYSSLR
jgi:hypothetical protein